MRTGVATARSNLNQGYKRKSRFRKSIPLLIMTVPTSIPILLFVYVPIWGWAMAFVDYSPGVNIFASKFISFHQFQVIFSYASEFFLALRNSLAMSFLGIIASPTGILLAIMISQVGSKFFKRVIQTVTTFPNFISMVIVYALFYAFFSVDDGMVNNVLLRLHLISQPFDLLSQSHLTWFLMTAIGMWKSAGWSAMVYIAIMANIDPELYQAAIIDGAGRFRLIWNVTIPAILPMYTVFMIIGMGGLLNNGFEMYFMFQNGLNHDYIQVLDLYVYQMGLVKMNFSYSTAVGIFKTGVSLVLLFVSNGIYKKVNGNSIV